LAAIHAFFQYVAINEPACALQCQRVLAIPSKRLRARARGVSDRGRDCRPCRGS
jgi:hypothetical protein